MNSKQIRFLFLLLFLSFIACNHKSAQQDKETIAQADTIQVDTALIMSEQFVHIHRKQYDSLVSLLPNPISLYTLLMQITNQQNVKILAELKEEYNDAHYPDPKIFTTTYSGGGYSFKMKRKELDMLFASDLNDENTIFYDGKKKIVFRNYKVSCYNDPDYLCDDFGFNDFHDLIDPKIIEVCGKKFLYSGLGFPCNGMGCGQHLFMIYDLKEKKPTFIGDFRLYFDGFLLSDFNNDGIPDLLVTARTNIRTVRNTTSAEFKMKLLAYTYNRGTFRLNKDNYYDLYGIADIDYFNKNLSIENDHWFKSK